MTRFSARVDPEEMMRNCDLRTYEVDPQRALAVLGYTKMLALAGIFERWALTEDTINPDQRTTLMRMSADYEAIAKYCGPAWKAINAEDTDDPMLFLAGSELCSRSCLS